MLGNVFRLKFIAKIYHKRQATKMLKDLLSMVHKIYRHIQTNL